jgi:hypothetical protein
MLLETVHLPSLYAPPHGDATSPYFYGACLGLLSKMLANCVVLVDGEDAVLASVRASIGQWPPQHRKKGQEMLMELRRRKRLVRPPQDPSIVSKGTDACASAKDVAFRWGPQAVIGPDSCRCGLACFEQIPSTWIGLEDYESSDFERKRHQLASGKHFEERELSREEFEASVLEPLLKYSRKMVLVDRQFGRSERPPGSHINLGDIPANYLRGLKWLSSVFARVSRQGGHRRVVLITELSTWSPQRRCFVEPDQQTRTRAEKTLRVMQRQIARDTGVDDVELDFRPLRGSLSVPHDRFLVTDQATIGIGNGIDLLNDDRSVRATTLSWVDDGVPWGKSDEDEEAPQEP